jgi:capsular exopolysaccharide synthesis family protein
MNAAPSSEVRTSLDPARVLHLLGHHPWTLAFCALLGLALALAYVRQRPAYFVSRAVLEVRGNEATPLDFDRRERADPDSAAVLKTLEQTLAGQTVLRQVVTDLGLASDPSFAPPRPDGYSDTELIKLLAQRVQVGLVRGTRLIAIEVRDTDPARARLLTQAIIDAFFDLRASLRREGADSAHSFLLAEARRLGLELRAAEERVQDYQEANQTVSLTDRHDIVVQRLADLARQVTAARTQRLSLQSARDQVLAVLEEHPEQLANLREIAVLQDIVEQRRELNAVAARVASYSLRYRDKHPSLIQARQQLAQMQASLRASLVAAGRAVLQAHDASLASERALEEELVRQQRQAMELARLAIAHRALEREAQSTDALYQQVLARLKTSGVGQSLAAVDGLGGHPVQIVEQPMVPVSPAGVSDKLILLAGLLAGAGLGAGLILLRRAFDPSFLSLDDAEASLGVPALAAIPRSTLRGADLLIHSHPATLEAEAFRSLRTSIALLPLEQPPRSVLFTSAVPAEGKSFCAANYAAALAQQGLRTLLIDADLRRPGLRRRFATGPATQGAGLADCLRDLSQFPGAVRPTRLAQLFVLGELQGSVRGAELLTGRNFRAVIDSALADFDRVVVDTAPLTAVGDTATMAPHVGVVCLVIRAGRTPRRVVHRACVILGRRPSGLVLNRIKSGRAARYDYYSHADDYIRDTPRHPAPANAPA